MNETIAPTIELPSSTSATGTMPDVPTSAEAEGGFASGERTEPQEPDPEADLHGDFAAGERTEPQEADPEADLHGDFAAGERTEPVAPDDAHEGTFADTTTE